ncbi:cytochrome c oxidase subunit II [Nitrincola sp. MINF-07-Sa-05]|uniref:cytochrome c oxidase subunit II n=1 Tax=Nitrincola salilacus TaxID=3400273 RepID=UPI0039184027
MIWPCGLLLSQTGCTGPYSALDPQGPAASEVALLWWGMFGFATLVLLAVVVLWHYAIKRRAEHVPATGTSRWIIWGGLALPTVSIIVLLIVGVPVGHRMMPLPDENALQIQVTGHQWYWQVAYPEHGLQMIDELHIPINTPVHLHLTSEDVIHSFWVPRLGVKLDMLPGRTNVLRLEASAAGVYRGQCAEYCGLGHAHMQFTVTAYDEPAFANWLNEHNSTEQERHEPDLPAADLHKPAVHEATLDE